MFKTKEDYKVIASIIKGRKHVPAYEGIVKKQKFLGDGFIVRDGCSADPIHDLMVGFMGIETFINGWTITAMRS